jgi:HNH/Endo VII superfamily nuclease toxins
MDTPRRKATIVAIASGCVNKKSKFAQISVSGSIPNSRSFWRKAAACCSAIVNKDRPAFWGNYFVYKVSNQYFVVAEHISDPNAPCPTGWSKPCKHFHIGTAGTASSSFATSKTPDAAAIEFFRTSDYTQIQPDHHFFYKNN